MSLFSKINIPEQLIARDSWLVNRFLTQYGCKEDSDTILDNVLTYSMSPLTTTPMSENPSLKKFFKEISNQLTLSSCVANATADAFEAQIAQRKNLSPDKVENLSRLFIYWNARNLENPPAGDKDDGTKIRLAFDSLARYGAPFESVYPYNISLVNKRPTILAYREAIKNRINKFYKIVGTGEIRIFQIKQALCSGNPVVFGTAIANSFREVNSEEVVKDPGGWYIGRHCMVITSFSEEKQAFEVRNSWGEKWGVKGYCWMDKNYIKADVTKDIWVPTI